MGSSDWTKRNYDERTDKRTSRFGRRPGEPSRGDRAKQSIKVGLLAFVSYFVVYVSDQYLGLYAWIMGGLSFLDWRGSIYISKDIYMSLGMVALGLLIIFKLGVIGGQNRPKKKHFKRR